MAFKVGDKARVSYNWKACASDEMILDQEERDKFAGKVITIEEVESSLNGNIYFDNTCRDDLGHIYGWYGDQLESAEEEMQPIIKDCICFDGDGRCLGTKGMDPCSLGYCPRLPGEKKNSEVNVRGVAPDAPVVVNENGGKQSDSPYAFHMFPVSSILAAAEVCAYGAKKYGETIGNRNYTKIPTEEHINHAIAHMYAYLAGDRTDDHLGHAIVRAMFAYDCAMRGDGS